MSIHQHIRGMSTFIGLRTGERPCTVSVCAPDGFTQYRKGYVYHHGAPHPLPEGVDALWYRAESGLEFPVPITDTGDATFLPQYKSITLMRYIRKHLDGQ